jgi:DNA-binding response OmpR family regulator
MHDYSRALVVDDDPIARKTVKFALEQEGFLCETAVDGFDALQHLRENDYALVVTDLRMPKKHGHALSVELLGMDPRPVIVVHSGVDDPRLTKDLIRRGVDDIVYKPTKYATFAAKMRGFVDRRARASRAPSPLALSSAPQAETSDASAEPASQEDAPRELPPELKSSVAADSPVPLAYIESRLSLVQRVMPVSSAALDVFEMTRSGCDAPELGEAICRDPALAAEVLAIANSNFYNPSGNAVTELDKAVVRIGQRRTGELALAASTLTSLTTRNFSWMDMQTTWRQSIASGVAIEMLVASGKHGSVGESLALVAIMHSLGRVVLGTLYPDHYLRLIKQCEAQQESLIEQEKQVFPENHAMIMTRLLGEWNIPEQISSSRPA